MNKCFLILAPDNHDGMNLNTERILTHKEFRSAFVTRQQRKDFLLMCARQGFLAIRNAWPECNIRMFVFGSAANLPVNIGAGSDLDIAISGLDHIAPKGYQRGALIMEAFRKGLPIENHTLPVDVLTFNAENPQTWFAKEILKNGLEITVD